MRWYLVAAILVIAFLGATAGWAEDACTIAVQPDESIQAAIDRAPDGAVICLPAGSWAENIVIDKNLTLRSEPGSAVTAVHMVEFQVTGIAGMDADQRRTAVDRVIQTFRNRVTLYGLTGVKFASEGTDKILAEFPSAIDPQTVIKLLSRPGELKFCVVVDAGTDPDELNAERKQGEEVLPAESETYYYLVGAPLLTGKDISEAQARTMTSATLSQVEQPYIAISFTEQGAKKFAQLITDLKVNDRLAIVLDGVVYTAPRITQSIKDAATEGGWKAMKNSTTIQGVFTQDEAARIAAVLQSGALPYPVVVVDEPTATATVLRQANYGPAIKIDTATAAGAVHVVLAGLTVNGTVSVSGTAKVEIHDCTVSGGMGDGIELGQDARAAIDGCTVTGSNAGIVLWNNSQATIDNSVISKNARGGIELWEETTATIRNCTVVNNQLPGILMQNSADATVEACTLQANEYGVALSKSAHVAIKNCTVTKNDIGVVCWDDSTADIEGCTISNNGAGVILTDSSQATLIGNEIKHNDQGISLLDPACTATDQHFQGRVTGHGNVIPGPNEPDGNSVVAVCPPDLSFLTSETGGKFDRQQ